MINITTKTWFCDVHIYLLQISKFFCLFFSKYDELFSGTLGAIPNIQFHLQLKPNAKPYFAKAYSILQSIYQIARDKVDELTRIGVLI